MTKNLVSGLIFVGEQKSQPVFDVGDSVKFRDLGVTGVIKSWDIRYVVVSCNGEDCGFGKGEGKEILIPTWRVISSVIEVRK